MLNRAFLPRSKFGPSDAAILAALQPQLSTSIWLFFWQLFFCIKFGFLALQFSSFSICLNYTFFHSRLFPLSVVFLPSSLYLSTSAQNSFTMKMVLLILISNQQNVIWFKKVQTSRIRISTIPCICRSGFHFLYCCCIFFFCTGNFIRLAYSILPLQ